MRKSVSTYRLPVGFDATNPDHIELLNKSLQNIEQRLDTIQQIGAQAPASVINVTATGKQGAIWLTWNRVVNVDGYVVMAATDQAMSKNIHKWSFADADVCSHAIPMGNSATQYFFTVSAYRGNQMGQPSVVVTATSVVFSTSTESAPPVPIQDPRSPTQVPRNGTTIS